MQPSSSPTTECRDNENFDPSTYTIQNFGTQDLTLVLTQQFDLTAFEDATCSALKDALPDIIVSCCTEATTAAVGGRRLQLNNTNTTNTTVDVVFDTTIVTIGELSCAGASSNETCQEVLSDAINSDVFGDMIGGTVEVVDLQPQLSAKSSKSGTSGGSSKSSKSGTSGGSMKSSKSMKSGSSF